MNDWFDLSGRTALVTGAARGLGAATAAALARAGAAVLLTDINRDGLDEQQRKFAEVGLDVRTAALDVTDEDAIRRCMESLDCLDILVNNAGIILRKPIADTTSDEFRRVLDVDLVSMLAMSRAAAPLMVAAGGGRIINLSSIMGHIGRAGQATYVAAKHGVVGLTKALAAELGPTMITVNAVAPGYFYTEMNQAILEQDPEFHASVIARTPLRRWADADELGGVMVFLASRAGAYLTGQTLVLDGGMTVTVPEPRQRKG